MSLALFPEQHGCARVRTVGGNAHFKRRDGTYDGEWRVCAALMPRKCVVYSFGIGWDWSFDDEMAGRCNVYSFDPSMGLEHHRRPSGVTFFPYALGPRDARITEPRDRSWRQDKRVPAQWVQRSLSSIMTQLGHTRLSILKIDIEGGEWDVLRDVMGRADQLLVEVHFRNVTRELGLLHELSQRYALFSTVRNSFAMSDDLRGACFELSYRRRGRPNGMPHRIKFSKTEAWS